MSINEDTYFFLFVNPFCYFQNRTGQCSLTEVKNKIELDNWLTKEKQTEGGDGSLIYKATSDHSVCFKKYKSVKFKLM